MKSIKLKLVLVSMICIFILAGCGKDEKDTDIQNSINQEINESEDSVDINENTHEQNEDIDKEETDNQGAITVDNQEKIEIKIAALKGPTGMGMAKLMEDAQNGMTSNDYKFTIAGEADVISTGLIKGDFDIAAVPCNLASVLYNKTSGKIKLAAINTLGVLYIVETGNTVTSLEDLKGRTIYSTGYGTTPQYTLNYLLSSYGLDPEKDLTIEYKTEATEVAAMLENDFEAIAMLPQPYVTTVMMNNDKVRIAIDIDKEWTAQNQDGSGVITGVLVVNQEFLNKYPEAVEDFLNEYQDSADFVNKNVDQAAELIEKFDIFKAAVAKKAIPYCNITFIRGLDMKDKVEGYLNILFNQNPNSVGGAMPAEDFYYIQ